MNNNNPDNCTCRPCCAAREIIRITDKGAMTPADMATVIAYADTILDDMGVRYETAL